MEEKPKRRKIIDSIQRGRYGTSENNLKLCVFIRTKEYCNPFVGYLPKLEIKTFGTVEERDSYYWGVKHGRK